MALVFDRDAFDLESTTTPNYSLLRNDCVGCHFGTNDGTNETPYVLSSAPPNYIPTGTGGNTLAGGNFYWVADPSLPPVDKDTRGHNVVGITGPDTLSPSPGGSFSSQLRCAGSNGCHGDRGPGNTDQVRAMRRTHHPLVTAIKDGLTPANSYRFLNGIAGYEDSDWEFQPTTTNHNQYKGVDRTSDTQLLTLPSPPPPLPETISHFCSICHGNFHNGSGKISLNSSMSSPWLRHPTDFDLGKLAGSEVLGYDGDSDPIFHDYNVAVPLASFDVTSVKTKVFLNSGDAIITCLSCHRAHGTPFYKMLRWDYKSSNLEIALYGCVKCHTSKN